jgi:hypothetical protein
MKIKKNDKIILSYVYDEKICKKGDIGVVYSIYDNVFEATFQNNTNIDFNLDNELNNFFKYKLLNRQEKLERILKDDKDDRY